MSIEMEIIYIINQSCEYFAMISHRQAQTVDVDDTSIS